MSQDPTSYERSLPLIKKFAGRVHRRCQAAGVRGFGIDDIEQELWIAWCKARESYKPDQGAQFSTYLYNGMIRHINRIAGAEIAESIGAGISLDQQIEDTNGLGEVIPDQAPDQNAIVFARQMRTKALEAASDTTRQFIEFMVEPPPELVSEFRAVQARAGFGKSKGLGSIAPRDIHFDFVAKFMGLSVGKRAKVYREIRKLAETNVALAELTEAAEEPQIIAER